MAIGKDEAIDAAIAILKGLNGSAFFTNLGGRVYTRLFTPPQFPDVELPFACLALNDESETIEYEAALGISKWRMKGLAFFAENAESDPLNTTAKTATAKFRDGVVKAFMADQSLSGQVKNCMVVFVNTISGAADYAQVEFHLEFEQMFSASDLS
jgi:hypothetical protein